jgi:hypothetical protein
MGARIFIALFGLPFFAVGIWACYSITTDIYDWQRMKSWEPVQAKVIDAELVENHDSDGGTTYKAKATYEYYFMGEQRRGSRVAISESSDNIGHFNEDLARKLEGAKGKTIEAYANPAKPEESIINRDIRWGMVGFKAVFLFAFGGVGLGMMLAAVFSSRFERVNKAIATDPQYAQTPWLANKDWQTNEIKSQAKGTVYFAWGFAVLWNLISMPLPFLLVEEITVKKNYPALLGLLFPIVGVGLLIWAVRQTIEYKKFGQAPLVLDPFPGSIGGQVGGTIELPYPYDPNMKYVFTLSNIYSFWSRSGKNSERRERVDWQDTAVGHAEQGIYGTRLSFRFDVPEGRVPSDAVRAGRDYYLWRVNLTADMPGVDVDRDYEIPVYATKQKSAHIAKHVAEVSQQATLEMDTANARQRLTIRPGAMGDELFYPMGRNIGMALGGFVIGLIFTGVGLTIATIRDGSYFFGGIFMLFGVPITFSSFYICINSLQVEHDGQGNIIATRRIFGIPVKKSFVPRDDLTTLAMESTLSTNHGNKQVKHYTLYVPQPGTKKVVVGEGFRGEGEAAAGMKLIQETFGVSIKR